jgi:hypothetical protein
MLGAISENLLQKDNHELCHAEHTLLTCDSAPHAVAFLTSISNLGPC